MIEDNEKINKLVDHYFGNKNIPVYINNIKHTIVLNKKTIINQCPYTVPLKLRAKLIEHLQEPEKRGVIRKSVSNNSSLAFVILKQNGYFRLVVDYLKLNQITTKMFHPIPIIHEMLLDLKDMK